MKRNTRKTITIDGEKITAPMSLLNTISILYHESAELAKLTGYEKVADMQERYSFEIYNQLEELGFYDNLK